MTAKELIKYLTEDAGLDEAQAQALAKVAENEKVSTRAAALKQASEYDSIATKATQLQEEKEKALARTGELETWYQTNFPRIKAIETEAARYRERYGSLDEPTVTKPADTKQFSAEDVAKLVDERIQGQYGNQWSNLLKGSGRIIEKHLRSGRKNEIDWDKVSEIAAKKGGDLVAAYDEYDAPEREIASKAAEEKRIEARVKEELAKRQTAQFFPAGADASPSATGIGAKTEKKTYDRAAVVQAFMSSGQEKVQ